jgi:hypothetical protein
MEITVKIHNVDKDMVEMYSNDGRWLMGVCHIDSFDKLGLNSRLYNGEEITLNMEVR